MMNDLKRRLFYSFLAMLCFILCFLIVRFFSGNPFIRGFSGDIIIILMLYFLLKIFSDFNPLKLAVFVLAVAFTTEFLQYFKLINVLGLENNAAARVILGAVFDPLDLLAYTIGTVIVYFTDLKLIRSIVLKIRK